jgi:ligand-binding SRPBCC domain-containing protein
MVKGHFRSFEHGHYFEPTADTGTIMRDRLVFEAPFGPFGWLAERLILRAYLARFLRQRDAAIKRIAESPSDEWQEYLQNTGSRS